jgi:hypothetical protein
MVTLVYLREHTTPAKIAAGFGISESTAHAYTRAVVDLLTGRAPGMLKTLREHDPDFILLDGPKAQDRGWTTGIRRRPLQELTPTEETLSRVLAAARAPVERGVAILKSWRIFRRSAAAPTA